MRGFRPSTLLILGLVLGLAAGGIAPSVADSVLGAPAVVPVQSPFSAASFSTLAETVKPAVININAERHGGGRTPSEEFYGEEFFRRFFGQAPERMPRRSLGSGVIIDPSGVALTNAHVVANATQIEVVLLDGSKHRATVVGADRTTDLAVLRLQGGDGQRFPHLPLGNSAEVQVGDWVIAVGSPFGLQATVTSGIVSAKARQLGAGPFDDFLQTDAAINPGNSGGPLVNMRGEVIGINTAIVRGGSGIGFAIPASMARRVSSELLATGKVTRGWLGVALQPLTPDLAASFGVADGKGALVSEVVPDSPAAHAGLQAGDVVTEINGVTVEGPGDLARTVGLASPGEDATIRVWRDKREQTIEVKLREAPGQRQAGLLGLQVRPVTPEVAAELRLRSADGVVVVAVDEGGPAAEAGLRRGDVIVEVNREPVKTLADFERLTRDAARNGHLAMRVQRGDSSLYVAVAPAGSDAPN
jgi:serine protease Do